MNGSILVTGASGFIGGHVARHLHAQGHPVIATGRDAVALDALRQAGIAVRPADLATEPVEPLLQGVERIVHAAALSAPWGWRSDFLLANVTATERLLAAARRAGVRHLVHLSSPSIYFRMQDQSQIPEPFVPPTRWITAYAESKWLAEQTVLARCDARLTAVMLRPRAVFGPGDRAIFPRIVQRAASGRFPLVDGGRAVIDLTHVDNVVQAVDLALTHSPAGNVATFNITNGEPMAVRRVLDHLFSVLDMPVRYVRLPRRLAMPLAALVEAVAARLPAHPEPPVSRYTLGVLAYSQTLDIRAARGVLGYRPQVGVLEGISRLAADWNRSA